MGEISTTVPYSLGMTYGRGFDSLTGRIRGVGLLPAEAQSIPNAGGQVISYYLNKVESTHELEKSIGLDLEANAQFAQFGLFGASAKFSFAEESAFNSYSVFLVARIEVINAFKQVMDPKLDAESWSLLKDGKEERFREQCGDSFVAGLQTGGEFCAVLELRTESTSDQRTLSASLSGSYGVVASGEASFSSRMREATSNRFLKISVFQAGGTETSTTDSVEEILARTKNYAAAVRKNPIPYVAQVLDYGTLDLPAPPNFPQLERARNVLLQYARQRDRLLALLNDLSYIRENPRQFVEPDLPALNAAATDCADRLNGLTDNASAAANSPADARYIDVGLPVITLPARREVSAQVEDSGGPVASEPTGLRVPDLIGKPFADAYALVPPFNFTPHGWDEALADHLASGPSVVPPIEAWIIERMEPPPGTLISQHPGVQPPSINLYLRPS